MEGRKGEYFMFLHELLKHSQTRRQSIKLPLPYTVFVNRDRDNNNQLIIMESGNFREVESIDDTCATLFPAVRGKKGGKISQKARLLSPDGIQELSRPKQSLSNLADGPYAIQAKPGFKVSSKHKVKLISFHSTVKTEVDDKCSSKTKGKLDSVCKGLMDLMGKSIEQIQITFATDNEEKHWVVTGVSNFIPSSTDALHQRDGKDQFDFLPGIQTNIHPDNSSRFSGGQQSSGIEESQLSEGTQAWEHQWRPNSADKGPSNLITQEARNSQGEKFIIRAKPFLQTPTQNQASWDVAQFDSKDYWKEKAEACELELQNEKELRQSAEHKYKSLVDACAEQNISINQHYLNKNEELKRELEKANQEKRRAHDEARKQLEAEYSSEWGRMKNELVELQMSSDKLERDLDMAKAAHEEELARSKRLVQENEQLNELFNKFKGMKSGNEATSSASNENAELLKNKIDSLNAQLAVAEEGKQRMSKAWAKTHAQWMEEKRSYAKQPIAQRSPSSRSPPRAKGKQSKCSGLSVFVDDQAATEFAQQASMDDQLEIKRLKAALDTAESNLLICEGDLKEESSTNKMLKQKLDMYEPIMREKDDEIKALREELDTVRQIFPSHTQQATSAANADRRAVQRLTKELETAADKWRTASEETNRLKRSLAKTQQNAIAKQEKLRMEIQDQAEHYERRTRNKLDRAESIFHDRLTEVYHKCKNEMLTRIEERAVQTETRVQELEKRFDKTIAEMGDFPSSNEKRFSELLQKVDQTPDCNESIRSCAKAILKEYVDLLNMFHSDHKEVLKSSIKYATSEVSTSAKAQRIIAESISENVEMQVAAKKASKAAVQKLNHEWKRKYDNLAYQSRKFKNYEGLYYSMKRERDNAIREKEAMEKSSLDVQRTSKTIMKEAEDYHKRQAEKFKESISTQYQKGYHDGLHKAWEKWKQENTEIVKTIKQTGHLDVHAIVAQTQVEAYKQCEERIRGLENAKQIAEIKHQRELAIKDSICQEWQNKTKQISWKLQVEHNEKIVSIRQEEQERAASELEREKENLRRKHQAEKEELLRQHELLINSRETEAALQSQKKATERIEALHQRLLNVAELRVEAKEAVCIKDIQGLKRKVKSLEQQLQSEKSKQPEETLTDDDSLIQRFLMEMKTSLSVLLEDHRSAPDDQPTKLEKVASRKDADVEALAKEVENTASIKLHAPQMHKLSALCKELRIQLASTKVRAETSLTVLEDIRSNIKVSSDEVEEEPHVEVSFDEGDKHNKNALEEKLRTANQTIRALSSKCHQLRVVNRQSRILDEGLSQQNAHFSDAKRVAELEAELSHYKEDTLDELWRSTEEKCNTIRSDLLRWFAIELEQIHSLYDDLTHSITDPKDLSCCEQGRNDIETPIENDMLRGQIADFMDKLAAAKHEITRLRLENENYADEIARRQEPSVTNTDKCKSAAENNVTQEDVDTWQTAFYEQEEKVSRLTAEVTNLKDTLDELTANRNEHEKAIRQSERTRFEAQHEDLKSMNYEKEVRLRQKHEEDLQRLRKEMKQMREDFDEEEAKLREYFKNEQKQIYESLSNDGKRNEEQKNEILESMKVEHDKQVQRVKQEYEDRIRSMQVEQNDKMVQLMEQHQQEVESLRDEMATNAAEQRSKELEELRTALSQREQHHINALEDRVQHEFETAAEQARKAQEEAVDRAKDEYQQQIDKIRSEHRNEISYLQDEKEETLAQMESDHAEQLADIKRSYENQIQQLEQQMGEQVNEVRRQCTDDQQQAIKEAAENARKNIEMNVDGMRQELESQIKELNAEKEGLVKEKEELERHLWKREAKVEQNEEQHAHVLNRVKMEVEDLKSHSMRYDPRDVKKRLDDATKQAEEYLAKGLEEAREHMEKELAERTEAMRNRAARQNDQFAAMTEEWENERNSLKHKLDEAYSSIKDLQAEADSLQSRQVNHISSLKSQLAASHEAELERLRESLQQKKIEELEKQGSKLEAEAESRLREAKDTWEADKAREIAALKSDYEEQMRNFEEQAKNVKNAELKALEEKHRDAMERAFSKALAERETAVKKAMEEKMAAIQEVEERCQKEVDSAKEAASDMLEKMKQEYESSSQDKEQRWRREKDVEIENAVREAKRTADKTLQQSQTIWQKRLEDVVNAKEREMLDAVNDIQTEAKHLSLQHAQAMEGLQMQYEEDRTCLLARAEEHLRATVDRTLAQAEEEKSTALQSFNAEWSHRLNKREDELRKEYEMKIQSLKSQYADEMESAMSAMEQQRIDAINDFMKEAKAERERMEEVTKKRISDAVKQEQEKARLELEASMQQAEQDKLAAVDAAVKQAEQIKAKAVEEVRKQCAEEQEEAMEELREESEKLLGSIEGAMNKLREERDLSDEECAELREQLEAQEEVSYKLRQHVESLKKSGIMQGLILMKTIANGIKKRTQIEQTLIQQKLDELNAMDRSWSQKYDELQEKYEREVQKLNEFVTMQNALFDTLMNYKKEMLLEHKIQSSVLQNEIADIFERKTSLEKSREELIKTMGIMEGQVQQLEAQMQSLFSQRVIKNGEVDNQLKRRKQTVQKDIDLMIVKISEHHDKIEDIKAQIQEAEDERTRKEEQLKYVEAQLVNTLLEQQKKLMYCLQSVKVDSDTNGQEYKEEHLGDIMPEEMKNVLTRNASPGEDSRYDNESDAGSDSGDGYVVDQ